MYIYLFSVQNDTKLYKMKIKCIIFVKTICFFFFEKNCIFLFIITHFMQKQTNSNITLVICKNEKIIVWKCIK